MPRKSRPKITEVFTPRSAEVNPAMYVPRPFHERSLTRSIEGALHCVICGESGSGKSWLYKKVAGDNSWELFTANFANAARARSVTVEIGNAILPRGSRELRELQESLQAGLNIGIANGGGEATRTYYIAAAELLERAFEEAREKAGANRLPVLVIDNLEAIFSEEELLKELGNIILLLDDDRYARFGVKILIVGVPANLIEYFQKIQNLEPVANRLRENPHIQALEYEQVSRLIEKGLIDLLQVEINRDEFAVLITHVYDATLGIASRVQEYCEQLAYQIEDNEWFFNPSMLDSADIEFVRASLFQAYAVVDRCMNEKETRTGRRNQVLYALGRIDEPYFDANHVEAVVREEFPDSTRDIQLGIPQILAELTSDERRLLRRSGRGATYRFEDPRYLMCLRLVLTKSSEGKVQKLFIRR